MISIIIPVYNGEAHLDRCVSSVLSQSYRELEVILVNDGSTDNTAALCDKWAAEDPRVRVLHQENGGVSAARNAGLEAATGAFIGFVDADDTILEDTYTTALEAIEGCDMVMWDTVTISQDGSTEPDTIPQLSESRRLIRQDFTPQLLRWMAGSVCRCLYRAELLRSVRFPLGIRLSEDRLFNLQAMGKAGSIHYLKLPMYRRYIRPGSAVMRYHGDLWEKNQKAWSLAMAQLEAYWDDRYKPVYTRLFLIEGALCAIRQVASRDYPGKARLAEIRDIADAPLLTKAFSQCPPAGLQERLLFKKAARLLLFAYRLKNL